MGYFDGLVEASFKKGADGRTIFYPYGVLGKGYHLSGEGEEGMRVFVRGYLRICLPIAILSVSVLRLYALPLLIILLAPYTIGVRRLLPTDMQATEKLTFAEVNTNMAEAMGLVTCFLLLLGSVGFLFAAIVAFFHFEAQWIGIAGAILFGATGMQSILLVRKARKSRRSEKRTLRH